MVYVLTVEWERDYESGTDTSVYSTIENAYKAFHNEMKNARQDFDGEETEESDYVDGDMSWSIWKKGYYSADHCDITIRECGVK